MLKMNRMKFRLTAMIPPPLYSDSDGNTFYCEILFQIKKLNNLCFRILRFNTVILQNMFSGLKNQTKKKIHTNILLDCRSLWHCFDKLMQFYNIYFCPELH